MDGVPSTKMMVNLIKRFKMSGIDDFQVLDKLNGSQEIVFYKDSDNQIIIEVGKNEKKKISGSVTIDGINTPITSIDTAEQSIALFAHDVGTGEGHWRDVSDFRYLSVTDMANELGIRTAILVYYRLPFPDVYIGNVRGWKRETFESWKKRHPNVGKGAHGVPPKPPSESQKRGRKGILRKYEWWNLS